MRVWASHDGAPLFRAALTGFAKPPDVEGRGRSLILLAVAADIAAKCNEGMVPLHLASLEGHEGAMALLLAAGAHGGGMHRWSRVLASAPQQFLAFAELVRPRGFFSRLVRRHGHSFLVFRPWCGGMHLVQSAAKPLRGLETTRFHHGAILVPSKPRDRLVTKCSFLVDGAFRTRRNSRCKRTVFKDVFETYLVVFSQPQG